MGKAAAFFFGGGKAELSRRGTARARAVERNDKNQSPSPRRPSSRCPRAHTHAHTPLPHSTATPKNETEADRLQAILDSFPTTEADDWAAIQSTWDRDRRTRAANGGRVRRTQANATLLATQLTLSSSTLRTRPQERVAQSPHPGIQGHAQARAASGDRQVQRAGVKRGGTQRAVRGGVRVVCEGVVLCDGRVRLRRKCGAECV